MILDTTSRKIQVVLTTAKTTNDMPVVVDWVDNNSNAGTFIPGSTLSNTNGVTPVDIVPAPAANTQRKINGITIYNKDTAAKTVQITLFDGLTGYQCVDIILQIDDILGFTDISGWYCQDVNGNRKTISASSGQSMAVTIHGSTNKATIVDADEFGIYDSVSTLLNKLTWANLKTTLWNTLTVITAASSNAAAAAGSLTLRGGQIGFPATQVPSTDPNTFDDYVENDTYVPTVTAGSGTFTTVSATSSITKKGREVTFSFAVTITNNGTAASSVNLTMPYTSAKVAVGVTRENAVTGVLGQCIVNAGASVLNLYTSTNTYPGATGYILIGTIIFNV